MASYYINATSGNDTTGTGTAALPYKTIAKGLTVASGTDTIWLQSCATAYANSSFTTAGISIRGVDTPNLQTGVYAHFNGGDAASPRFNITGASPNVTFDNIYFKNCLNTLYWNVDNVTGNPVLTIQNNIFDHMYFAHNTQYRNGLIAVSNVAFATRTTLTTLFQNNLIRNMYNGGNMFSCISTDFTIRNNTFHQDSSSVGPTSWGILWDDFYDSGTTTRIYNNIIFNEHASAFPLTSGITTGTLNVENNIYYNVTFTEADTNVNNISADPLFLDKTNKDYRLRPSSPAIDAGNSAL